MRIQFYTKFKKDVKRLRKQNKDLQKMFKVIDFLAHGRPLPQNHRDHPLLGEWRGFRDCHIEPDWVLIYGIRDDVLYLVRTGSHSEIFS